MNELINFTQLVQIQNNQTVTESRTVAEVFHRNHKDVLESIENMKAENSALINMFFLSTYKVEGNRKTYPMYYMNRDGFTLLVMGFHGKQALKWKIKYIEAFNAMEQTIKEHIQPLTQLDILAQNVQILQQQEKAILKLQESHNEIKEQQERQQSEIDTLNGVCIEGSKRDKLKHLINSMVNKMGITYSMGWSLFRDSFNTAYHTNVKLLITNYAKKNNLNKKPSLPEYLEQTNRLDDALRVAEKLVGKK